MNFNKPAAKRMRLSHDNDEDEMTPRVIEVITIEESDDESPSVAPEVITIEDSDDEEPLRAPTPPRPQPEPMNQAGAGTSFGSVGEISWSQRRIRRNKRFTNVIVRDLTFPNLGNLSAPLHVEMPRLFNSFLDHCLAASGVSNVNEAKFCLNISHPSFDKGSIFMNFRTRAQLDGVAILNFINKAQQSHRDVLLGADLHMEMYIFDEARVPTEGFMSGSGSVKFYFDEDLKIPGTVKNTDGYCLPKSLVVGMMKADEEAASSPEEKARLNRKWRNFVSRGSPSFHLELLGRASLPLGQNQYDLAALEVLAACNPDYMIVLYTRPPGQKLYTIYRVFNEGAAKIVNLGYHANHYDVITPVVGRNSFNAAVCRSCKSFYRSTVHRCKAKCTKCHTVGCDSAHVTQPQQVLCGACNVQFATAECHARHQAAVCRQFKVCRDCDRYYHVKATRPHQCESNYCSTCKKVTVAGHDCCWTPPTEDQKRKKLEKQERFKIVFYDFETVVLEDGVNLDRFAEEQWPNLVAYRRYCEACLESPDNCENCPQKSGHFKYQLGDSEWSVTDRFLDWILNDPSNNNALFIAHNGSRFDMHFLVSRLVHKGIYPRLLLNGTQLIQMNIEPLRGQKINAITFKDSYLLVPLPLSALPKAFDVPNISKGEFPYLFNHPINYGKTMPTLPARQYFCTDRKKADALVAFNSWYESRKGAPFNFDQELLEYCIMDVRILAECMIKYMVLATMTTGWNPIIHCSTFGSYSMLQLKMIHLKENQVGILPECGYDAGQKQSKIALQYIKWLEQCLNRPLIHKLNGGEHKVHIEGHKFLLDAYDPVENRAYEINGCIFHGCPECTDPNAKDCSREGKTMEEAYRRTIARKDLIEKAGVSVTMIWEHEIRAEMRANEVMRSFIADCQVVTRLAPRDAFLGGRTQTFKLLAEASASHTLEYVDFCSLYPYVTAFVAEYPVGTPTIITQDFASFENSCPYNGMIKCDVLPPTNLRYPVIGSRINGKLIFTNCRACAEKALNVPCAHLSRPDQRLIHTTVTHVELACAIERGYKVVKVYEVWHWTKWDKGGLFKDFVKKYIKIKQEASGWPKADMTPEEKAVFLAEHEEHVGVKLDGANIKKNPALRSIAKLQLNSVWGKMGQRPDKIETKILGEMDDEIGQIINDPKKDLTGFKVVNGVAYCSWRPEDSHLESAPYTNVAIAAYTTAHARLLLYKAMEKIGNNLVYTDTDSLIYLKAVSEPDPVADMRGSWLGMLTSEIPEGWRMTKFASPAAKVYSYVLENANGEKKEVIKAKGVSLDHKALETVNFEGMEFIVRQFVEHGERSYLEAEATLMKRCLGHISTVELVKKTSVVMDKLRFLPDFSTLPYGYSNQC